MSTHLFTLGNFKLHSGKQSNWKINCDYLTWEDYETLAWIVYHDMGVRFKEVKGIPRGGIEFALALSKYCSPDYPILICDDVLTTQRSFNEARKNVDGEVIGVCIFSRKKDVSDWIYPIFILNGDGK